MSNKAWGGRFEAQPEDWVDDFNACLLYTSDAADE